MFGANFNHESRFFADGYELSGIENVSLSYTQSANIVKPLGTKDGLTSQGGFTQQSLSLSRVLTYQDPVLGYTGEAPISGSIYYDDRFYGFESGYLLDYSVNCAVGSVPRVNSSFSITSELKSGVDASSNLNPVAHPEIDIPTQGSISATCEGSITNRVIGFDYSIKCNRKPYFSVGSLFPTYVDLIQPIEYTATVQIEADDAFLQDAHKFFEEKENKTVVLNVEGRNGTNLQTAIIPNATIVGESVTTSAEGSVKITLTYLGHFGKEEQSLDYANSYVYNVNGDVTGSVAYDIPNDWHKDDDDVYGLQVGNTCASIGSASFSGCDNISGDLLIQKSVTSIGDNAFDGCSGFRSNLILRGGLNDIGSEAFSRCGFIGDLIIPNSLTTIGDQAFGSCGGFDGRLRLPNTISSINSSTFSGCSGFTEKLELPDSVVSISDAAFADWHSCTEDLVLKEGIQSIGDDAFINWYNLRGDITIPDSTLQLGKRVFKNCEKAAGKITLGQNLTGVKEESFKNCKQISEGLTIPNSVSVIESGAFENCNSISSFEFGNGLTAIENNAFNNCLSAAGSLLIPSVEFVGDNSFSNCEKLNGSINLDSAISIGDYAFSRCKKLVGDLYLGSLSGSVGDGSFFNCSSLDGNLTIGDNVTSVGNISFDNCSSLTGVYIGTGISSIGSGAFRNCSFRNDISIGQNITSIGASAFQNCDFVGSLELESSLTGIYESAFNGCTGIEDVFVDFEPSVFKGDDAFRYVRGCLYVASRYYEDYIDLLVNGLFQGMPVCEGSYSTVVYNSSTEDIVNRTYGNVPANWYDGETSPNSYLDVGFSADVIGNSAFENSTNLDGHLKIPNRINVVDNYAFRGCNGFDSLEISNGVETIGTAAFELCTNLKGNLAIPESVGLIKSQAFRNCYGLDGELSLGNGLTGIGVGAFRYCSGFNGSLDIPEGIAKVEYGSFGDCIGFDGSLNLNNVTEVDSVAFVSGKFTGPLSFPEGLTGIGNSAFRSCSAFTSLDLNFNLEFIGADAFKDCFGIKGSITLDSNIASIGSNAFKGCYNVDIINSFVPVSSLGVNSLELQTNPTNTNKLLYVEAPLYDDYYSASVTQGTPGFYDGNVLLALPVDPTKTLYYDSSRNVLQESSAATLPKNWARNGAGESFFIGSNTTSIENGGGSTEGAFRNAGINGVAFIPPTLKTIGDQSFRENPNMSTLIVSQGVESIGSAAFAFAGETDLTLPRSLLTVGANCFYQNANLQNLTLGDSNINPQTVFATNSFYDCGASATDGGGILTIGKSVKTIGNNCFDLCKNFGTAYVKAEKINTMAFNQTNFIQDLYIRRETKQIDYRAFYNMYRLDNLQLGEWYPPSTRVESQAFRKCGGGKVNQGFVDIRRSIDYIGERCFTAEDAADPKWITGLNLAAREVGLYAFRNQTNLKNINFTEDVKVIGKDGNEGSSFRSCTGLTELTIPDPQNIWHYSFNYCGNITDVSIGNETKNTKGRIENDAFRRVGRYAGGNGNLYIGSSIDYVGLEAFHGTNEGVSNRYAWIKTAEINARHLYKYAFFDQNKIEDITFGSGVKIIGKDINEGQTFRSCNLIKEVKIPDPQNIYYYSFEYCTGITGISIGNEEKNTQGIINDYAFRRIGPVNPAVGVIDLYVGSSIDSIGGNAFDSYHNSDNRNRYRGIKSATLNCRQIGFQAFIYQQNMTGVTFGSGVKVIGKDVDEGQSFYDCDGLTEVRIPDPEIINYFSFDYCDSITGIYIGNDTEDTQGIVNNEAFRRLGSTAQGAAGNGYIYIGNSIQDVKFRAFYGDRDWIYKADINATWLRDRAFQEQRNLTEVNLGNSVRLIETNCFDYCLNLKDVTIGNWVLNVGGGAFNNSAITGDLLFKAGNSSRDRTLKIYYDAFGGANNKPRDVYLNGDYWDGVSAKTSDSWVDFRNGGWPVNMSGAFYVTGDGWTIGESAGPNGKPVRQWTTYPNVV